MNRTLRKIQNFELSGSALRVCGMLLLALGMLGSVMQTRVLGVGSLSNSELFALMEEDASVMVNSAMALVCQALETCAAPLFAFLLVEGATHTSDFGKYFLRVLGLAAVSQIPYALLMTGSALGFPGFNPVFAMVMCLVMIYFFRRFPGKKGSHIAIKVLAVIGTFLWSNMLGISYGAECVIITAVLWGLRGKQNLQIFVGMMTALCCSVFSLFFMVAPLSFLVIYFYSGKPGSSKRVVNYLSYPVMLLVFWLISAVI